MGDQKNIIWKNVRMSTNGWKIAVGAHFAVRVIFILIAKAEKYIKIYVKCAIIKEV